MKTKLFFFVFFVLIAYIALGQKKVYSCIDESGTVLFNFETHYVWPFSNGMAMFKTTVLDVEKNKMVWRIGFIDNKGNVVIEPIYDSKFATYYGFNSGVSWARKPGADDFELINKKGEVISEKSYEKVGSFNDGLCAVYEDLYMGFVDLNGTEVIPCIYVGDTWFYDGLVCVCIGDNEMEQYGFLNKKGEVAIPFEYNQAGFSGFQNGEARVQIKGKTNLINTSGEVVFTPDLTSNMENFSDGLALAYINQDRSGYGFFNRNNEWVVEPIYDNASSFENGRSIVEKDGKYGVIDTTGKFILPLKFENIYGDCKLHGLYNAVLDNISYYYNCEGYYFTKFDVKHISGRESGKYYPYKDLNDKMGYLNTDGTMHVEARYNNVEAFSEGMAWVY